MIGEAHHYGITVSDLEESVAFYRDTLGMDELDQIGFDDEAFSRFVDVEDVDVDIVFLDAGGCSIELLEYENGGGNANEGVSNDTIGASHFCLAVDDVDQQYEELSDSVEFVSEPQTLENGAQVVYLYDPDGNTVELLEE
ncbi:VOC family protein [Halomicrococcus sp. NG-SE-24]|uniref:VOC family protein n=1 Tax=Halomicrococcus sp. NG-SE-24 TaxID=3436928 RepID=UPI003D990F7B